MEFLLGTETQDGYCRMELAAAAHKLVSDVTPVKPGQNVLITADGASDARVVNAVAGATMAAGGVPVVLWYPIMPAPMQEAPAPVTGAAAAADVWFDFASMYLLYSPSYQAAIAHKCIYVALPAMDVDMMVRTVGQTCPALLDEMRRTLYRISQEAYEVRVQTRAGTDLVMRVDGAGDPFWEDPQPGEGFAQMLLGQSGFMAFRDSYAGTLVIDGTIWPPSEVGLLREPVRLEIRDGLIQDVAGGPQALVFSRWLSSFSHREAQRMDHACYGFNPGVRRLTGRIVEDERLFGCVQFGIGASEWGSPVHTDGVVTAPTVSLDGVAIEEDGVYVHPELVRLCREMGLPGY